MTAKRPETQSGLDLIRKMDCWKVVFGVFTNGEMAG